MSFKLVTRVGTLSRDPVVLAKLAGKFLRDVVWSNRMTLREAIRQGNPIPPLYRSGVRYERERGPSEEFADVLTVLKRGWGDCDDLVGWRVAELLEAGFAADVRIYCRDREPGKPDYSMHAQVRHGRFCRCARWRVGVGICRGEHARGKIEDPSRRLGL